MTIAATYMSDLSRVRVTFSGYSGDADYAKVERTVDGITWVTVRGGDTVPITAGAGKVDDYEFVAGVLNTYRVTAIDAATPAALAGWTNAVGVNASVAPAIPAGIAAGNLMVLVASIRNSGAGVPVTPAGWTPMLVAGNVGVYGRLYVPGDTAPTCAFTGGVANADTIAMIFPFTNLSLTPSATLGQLNGSAQNIASPAFSTTGTVSMMIGLGWKQDDWTPGTVVALPGFAHGGERVTTTGDDAAMIFDYRIITNGPLSVGASLFGITGGGAAISRTLMVALPVRPFTDQETTTVTPSPTSVWIKNPSRPSVNTPVTVTGWGDITRPDRGTEHDVVNRTLPVAVTDVMGSRRFPLTITTATLGEAADMDQKLATGEPVFIQAPSAACPVPTLYAVIKGVNQAKHSQRTRRRFFELPLVEVAAPGSTVYGDTYTYNDVLADYASYNTVLSGNTSYSQLPDKVSDNEVVVP
jgi:hypothetical protein